MGHMRAQEHLRGSQGHPRWFKVISWGLMGISRGSHMLSGGYQKVSDAFKGIFGLSPEGFRVVSKAFKEV